jgi:hypothetical protein
LSDACQYEGKQKPAGIKLQYFCQYGDEIKKKQPKHKVAKEMSNTDSPKIRG